MHPSVKLLLEIYLYVSDSRSVTVQVTRKCHPIGVLPSPARAWVTRRYVRQAVLGGGRTGTLSTDIPGWVVLPNRVLTVLVADNAYASDCSWARVTPPAGRGLLWIYVFGVPAGIGPVGSRVVRSVLRLLTGSRR